MVQTQLLGGLSWQNKLRVERIVAWANLTQVTPANCWPGIAARRCNARSIAELEAGTVPTDPLISSVHVDMLALGFAGGLLDMELVVHSDRHKRERPAREARPLVTPPAGTATGPVQRNGACTPTQARYLDTW